MCGLGLGPRQIGDLGSAGAQRVYFITRVPDAEDFEIGAVGPEGVFGEGAVEMLEQIHLPLKNNI